MRETVRVTVTMPVEQFQELRKVAGHGQADSVSAYVTEAVGWQLRRHSALGLLRRDYAERGVRTGPEHDAWALRVLGIDADTPRAAAS